MEQNYKFLHPNRRKRIGYQEININVLINIQF